MKYTFILIVCFVSMLLFSCKTSKPDDSVAIADSTNKISADKGIVDEKSAAFFVDAADARMMGILEGKLAIQKGTTSNIRTYGKLMVKDQNFLLTKIKKIAASKSIVLPTEISADKKDGLKDLTEKQGKDFDEKFIKMMKIDHERDVKQFTNAKEIDDNTTRDFAATYISMIQSHLDKINILKDEQ